MAQCAVHGGSYARGCISCIRKARAWTTTDTGPPGQQQAASERALRFLAPAKSAGAHGARSGEGPLRVRYFHDTVRRIQAQEFEVKTPPEAAICKECDI